MNKGIDVAAGIIDMYHEYTAIIDRKDQEISRLRSYGYDMEKVMSDLKQKCNEYEHKLEIITDVIAKYMDHSEGGTLYISSIWNFDTDSDYMKIIKALEIPLSIDEVKE